MTPAQYCLACAAAERIGPVPLQAGDAAALARCATPPWLAADWHTAGWLTAQDAVLGVETGRVFYGWVLVSGPDALVVVRGTGDASEWAIDAEAWAIRPRRGGGMVEAGFYSVYESLAVLTDAGPRTLLEAAIGHSTVVTGHSLGAAVATYGTVDLALAGQPVAGRFFESPRPGDAEFAAQFHAHVLDYRVWRYAPDVVPDLPPIGFSPLQNLTVLPANPAICDSPACNHHAENIAWLLDPTCTAIVSGCRT